MRPQRIPKAMLFVGGWLVLSLTAGSTAIAAGAGPGADDHETPITGPALARASAVALAHTGGGRVTGTEVGDEEGYYEVEVTLDGGGQVDVHLGSEFKVLGSDADTDHGGADHDGSGR